MRLRIQVNDRPLVLYMSEASRIWAWRSRTGLSRQAFADRNGIPFRSLQVREIEKEAIGYKSREQYFSREGHKQ